MIETEVNILKEHTLRQKVQRLQEKLKTVVDTYEKKLKSKDMQLAQLKSKILMLEQSLKGIQIPNYQSITQKKPKAKISAYPQYDQVALITQARKAGNIKEFEDPTDDLKNIKKPFYSPQMSIKDINLDFNTKYKVQKSCLTTNNRITSHESQNRKKVEKNLEESMSNDGSRLKDKRIEELKKMDELFESIDIKIKHVLGSE